MAEILKVGVIGANAQGGWAGESHVPAIKALAGLELAAVATRNRKSADEAAATFGVTAYDDGMTLIADPSIHIVTVATRVPDHRDLVLSAIQAGKHVYCEWPLGATSEEAETMRAAADAAGIHHAIGLQLRESPTARAAAEAVRSGTIGRVRTITGFSSSSGFGPNVAKPFAYLEDPKSFANLVTIQGAHTLDLLLALVGDAASVAALLTRQFPMISVEGETKARRRETYDHLLAQGILGDDVTFDLGVAGGRTGETPAYIEIRGEDGFIRLEGGAPRGVQSARLAWSLNGKAQVVDEGELTGMTDAAANVGGVYAALRRDIVEGTRTVTDFTHAVALTSLVEQVFKSSEEGRRLPV